MMMQPNELMDTQNPRVETVESGATDEKADEVVEIDSDDDEVEEVNNEPADLPQVIPNPQRYQNLQLLRLREYISLTTDRPRYLSRSYTASGGFTLQTVPAATSSSQSVMARPTTSSRVLLEPRQLGSMSQLVMQPSQQVTNAIPGQFMVRSPQRSTITSIGIQRSSISISRSSSLIVPFNATASVQHMWRPTVQTQLMLRRNGTPPNRQVVQQQQIESAQNSSENNQQRMTGPTLFLPQSPSLAQLMRHHRVILERRLYEQERMQMAVSIPPSVPYFRIPRLPPRVSSSGIRPIPAWIQNRPQLPTANCLHLLRRRFGRRRAFDFVVPCSLLFDPSHPRRFEGNLAAFAQTLSLTGPNSSLRVMTSKIFLDNHKRYNVLVVDATFWPVTSIGDRWNNADQTVSRVAYRAFFVIRRKIYALYVFTPQFVNFLFFYSAMRHYLDHTEPAIFAAGVPSPTFENCEVVGELSFPKNCVFYRRV